MLYVFFWKRKTVGKDDKCNIAEVLTKPGWITKRSWWQPVSNRFNGKLVFVFALYLYHYMYYYHHYHYLYLYLYLYYHYHYYLYLYLQSVSNCFMLIWNQNFWIKIAVLAVREVQNVELCFIQGFIDKTINTMRECLFSTRWYPYEYSKFLTKSLQK